MCIHVHTVTLYSAAFKKIFDIPLRRRKRQSSALYNQRFRARALGARVARTLQKDKMKREFCILIRYMQSIA